MLEKISNISSNTDIDNESREPNYSEELPQRKIIEKDFKVYDYGYTGGQRFSNPPQKKYDQEPLEYFGYSYFSNISHSYFPMMSIPVPPDYLIGPDDNIKIILFGGRNSKYDLIVNRDGVIFIPEIGPLAVAGLDFGELKNLIDSTISSKFIGTEVSVTLGSLRSIDIFILGAANNPGMYSISALSSMTNAIFESGGVNTSGSLRDIKLKRNGVTISEFDLYSLLLNGDTSNDSRLMQGDVIFISPIGKTAAVRGEVNRPGIYELKADEDLGDLLEFAGNLKAKASRSNSEILRINESRNSYELTKLDLGINSMSKIEIKDGDVVSVYPINNKIQKAILLTGHTVQPGFYSWTEGMTITDLLGSADDILEMTDINYILIKRKNKTGQNYTFHQINLQQALGNDASGENLILYDQDQIILLPSLLSTDLITTKLIQDKLIDQETKESELVNEWNSPIYLRKSLLDEPVRDLETDLLSSSMETDGSSERGDIRRYYEYSIYDYCVIPENLASMIVMDEELLTEDVEMTITDHCRDELIDPMIDIIKRDNVAEKINIINVFGSVHFPGSYPYTEEMTLADAIRAAGGPKNGTYNSEIEITSLNNSGKEFKSETKILSIRDAEKVLLSRMDTISLKQISNQLGSVEITGEVYFPGVYPISQNETLSDLIIRAGGLNDQAYPSGAFFQREALKQSEISRLKTAKDELRKKILLSSQTGALGQESIDGEGISQLVGLLDTDPSDADSMGRLVIDLENIIENQLGNIVLEDGDKINIPKNRGTISVVGEVFVANSHVFKEDLNINDYINLSGGTTTFADNENIYIIKSDGSIMPPSAFSSGFFRASASMVKPGDTIVVPLQVQPFSAIKATTEVSQIIYQMAIAAAAVNSF